MTAWATVADVDTYTGVTVTSAEVDRAQALIELFAGTTTAASDDGQISTRNLRHLKMAVAYQAGWMSEHPDVFTHMDSSSFSQDGMSATPAHANASLLAPLASRCIRRLSWMLQPDRAYRPAAVYTDSGDRDSAAHDDDLPWIPMPGEY